MSTVAFVHVRFGSVSLFSYFTFAIRIHIVRSMPVSQCAISISIAQTGKKKQMAIPVDLKFRTVCQCDRNWRHFYILEHLNNGNYLYIAKWDCTIQIPETISIFRVLHKYIRTTYVYVHTIPYFFYVPRFFPSTHQRLLRQQRQRVIRNRYYKNIHTMS